MSAGVQRREFITLLGGAAAGSPIAAHAQQAAAPLVGFLHGGTSDGAAHKQPTFTLGCSKSAMSKDGI